MERSGGAVRTACDIYRLMAGEGGTPKLTWKKLTEKDCRKWKLTTVDLQERSTWRSGVRSAMHAASQLPGKGLTDVDDAPAPAHSSTSDYDDDDESILVSSKMLIFSGHCAFNIYSDF